MVEPYEDEFGIGQEKIATIRMAGAKAGMRKAAREAFTTAYIPPEWRAMRRRQFEAAQAEYDRAKAVLAALGEKEPTT